MTYVGSRAPRLRSRAWRRGGYWGTAIPDCTGAETPTARGVAKERIVHGLYLGPSCPPGRTYDLLARTPDWSGRRAGNGGTEIPSWTVASALIKYLRKKSKARFFLIMWAIVTKERVVPGLYLGPSCPPGRTCDLIARTPARSGA